MDLFNVTVKLGDRENDTLVHSAPRKNVTAIEIRLLKAIHGPHSIVGNPVKVGTVEREPQEELWRLCLIYKPRVVASLLKEDVSGWENYADQHRQAQDAEFEARQQERQQNDLRAKAAVQASAISAALNEPAPSKAPAPEKASRAVA